MEVPKISLFPNLPHIQKNADNLKLKRYKYNQSVNLSKVFPISMNSSTDSTCKNNIKINSFLKRIEHNSKEYYSATRKLKNK